MGVLGQGRVQELAGKLGMSNLDVEKGLASALPADNSVNDLLGQLAKRFLSS